MALRDITFYKYIEAAFRHKLYRDKAAASFNYLGYNLPYISSGATKGIFEYARRVLPLAYTNEFPNTEEGNLQMAKAVIEKLDKEAKLLEIYVDPTAVKEYELIVADARAQSEQAGAVPAQTPVGTATGTMGMPSLPSAPPISSAPRMPRVIQNIPPAPEPSKPEIAIANSSGVVTEPGDPSKLVKTTPSGAIAEPGKPSELVTTDRSGRIVGGPGAEASTKQIFIANKNNVVTGVRNIKSPSWLKTFGSNAQIFARKNLGRIAGGLGEIAGGVGRGIAGPGLNGLYNLSGKLANGGLSAFERFPRLSNPGFRGASRSFASSGSKKLVWGLIGAFFLLVLGVGLIGAITGTTPSGKAAPISTSNLLDYTLPLKDPSIVPQDIKTQVLAAFPKAKIAYWDLIVQRSIDAGFNPALALALWIEETGASQTTVIRNGGGGIPNADGKFTLGHLGCAPKEDQTIEESLTCLFKFVSNNNYSNEQFTEFMAAYSGGPADNPFSNNPNFPGGIKDWYSKLVPSGPGAIKLITSQPLGCPAVGTISTPYGYNIIDYHASNKGCGNLSSCHNGVDIAGSEGTPVKSTIDGTVTTIGVSDEGGNYVEITDQTSTFVITLEHLKEIAVKPNDTVSKGQTIGLMSSVISAGQGVTGSHTHYKIKKSGVLINPLRFLTPPFANPDPKDLISSDDLAQNNYANILPSICTPDNLSYCTDNWGYCNK